MDNCTFLNSKIVSQSCIFCKYSIQKTSRVLFETSSFFCLLDIKPVSFGHSLVIPKRHVVNFLDLSVEESKELLIVAKKLIEFIKNNSDLIHKTTIETVKSFTLPLVESQSSQTPTGFNIGINDGVSAGRNV
jgi:diadenosine tetraphosphate (Ap4A) HIT family hydrolase